MSYDGMGRNGLDYELCSYKGSRLLFRGPKADLSKRYVACIGTTETFGKHVMRAYPELLAQHLPAQTVNLGMINGGVDAFLGDRAVLDVAKQADVRIVQVLGALNQTNHFFKVHPRRNDRFVAPCEALVRMFPEIDFAEFHFTKAMLVALHACSKKRYKMLCNELQKLWLARMSTLLDELGERTILFWFASTTPPRNAIIDPRDPMLVDTKMLKKLRAHASAYIESVPDALAISEDHAALLKTVSSPVAAKQIMGPNAHLQASRSLQEVCCRMLE